MQPSFTKPAPPQKVKNILIRHSCSKEVRLNSSFQSPERFHLLKYSPKYYNTLSLEVTNENALQSKIKRIKKLKNFKGYFKGNLPPKQWLNLLANTRKEIEELPQIATIQSNIRLNQLFWARLTLWKIRFFPNIIRTFLPRRRLDFRFIQDQDDGSFIKKSFMGHLRNIRKVKTLEMSPNEANNEGEQWMREKLNGMSQFLNRLDNLTLKLSSNNVNIQELLKNQGLLSNLTSLILSSSLKFDHNLVMILQMCKKLRFLSVGLKWGVNNPEFLEFLTSIQSLPQLVGLEFDLPKGLKKYWSSFKPQTSLRSLKLRLDISDLVKTGLIGNKTKDILGHWEDIKEFDELEFRTSCKNIDDLIFLRMFITMVLKKVHKVKSFKCFVFSDSEDLDSSLTSEPFLVEEVPHLYGSLENFEYTLQTASGDRAYLNFDMKRMRVFRNLKEFKLDGNGLYPENIEEIVSLLEENEKEGDFPTLEIKLGSISSSGWLKDAVEKIEKVKRSDKNLKIKLDLKFRTDNFAGAELRFLDELCNAIKSVGFIKGLVAGLGFYARGNITPVSIEALKEVMSKHGEMRNLVVELGYLHIFLQYRKIDGEKEQFFEDNYEMW